MQDEQYSLPADLKQTVLDLQQLRPQTAGLDRDRLMFHAGIDAARQAAESVEVAESVGEVRLSADRRLAIGKANPGRFVTAWAIVATMAVCWLGVALKTQPTGTVPVGGPRPIARRTPNENDRPTAKMEHQPLPIVEHSMLPLRKTMLASSRGSAISLAPRSGNHRVPTVRESYQEWGLVR